MSNLIKALTALLLIGGLLALGLLLPSDDTVEGDPFEAEMIRQSLDGLGELGSMLDLREIVQIHPIHSSREDILSGRFKYREDDVSWRFTTPINWGTSHNDLEVRRVIARVALADPFLQNYFKTGNAQDFRQAAFFFLDWKAYYQDGRQITPHAWESDAVQARAARLAYILNQAAFDPTLLSERDTQSLIGLADFHLQRVVHAVHGVEQDTILQTPAFQALCETLDGLPNCAVLEP